MSDTTIFASIIDNVQVDDAPNTTDVPMWFGSVAPADLYFQTDAAAYKVATTVTPYWVGTTAGALQPIEYPDYHYPQEQSLVVNVLFGNFTSCTNDEFLQGKNLAYVGGAGRWECIYFRDVTANTDGTITLSHLLRCQRGTYRYASNHSVKDTVVIPKPDSLVKVTVPLLDIDNVTVYNTIVVKKGLDPADVSAIKGKIPVSGYALSPWPPINPRLILASGDITITWTRVDRGPSTMHDGDDTTPLTDTPESYTIRIYKLPIDDADAPVRSAQVTSAAFVYTAAEQTADGTVGATQLGLAITQDGPKVVGQPLRGIFNVNT